MIVQKNPDVHLTYCLNIHPGETWAENFAAIRDKTLEVRKRVGENVLFGLGLRLSHRAAYELAKPPARAAFRAFLREKKLYVFTINGFPYGRFHGAKIKEQVYRPDWRTTARRDYTLLLADILADLLETASSGSISTVPGSFKPWIADCSDVQRMIEMLTDCAAHLNRIRERQGVEIHLGLEPEPGCYLESTEEFAAFFKDALLRKGREMLRAKAGCKPAAAEAMIRRHIGVCFDTCHLAIAFEDLTQSLDRFRNEGIRISKVQISAAPEVKVTSHIGRVLQPFCEPVYLHQVQAIAGDGALRSWNDLPDALRDIPSCAGLKRLRAHFHVPLFFEGTRFLRTTAACLTTQFWERIRAGCSEHLEIETYTFGVLPARLRSAGVVKSIVREYQWVFERMKKTSGR